MKIDLNSNKCQWKHLAKQVCDFIKAQGGPPKLAELSIEEISEFGIYDSPSKLQRKELLAKKTRRVLVGSEIFMRLVLKNTLSTSVTLKQIRLGFSLKKDDQTLSDSGATQVPQSIQLPPHRSSELFLSVQPQEVGQLNLETVKWELFDMVQSTKSLSSIVSDFQT
jgi:hypothetical protein